MAAVEVVEQQRHVAPVGAEGDIERIAEERDGADETIERDVRQHAGDSIRGAPSARASLTIYNDMTVVIASPMPGTNPISASRPNRMVVPGIVNAVSSRRDSASILARRSSRVGGRMDPMNSPDCIMIGQTDSVRHDVKIASRLKRRTP